jgi:aryl-alcohol dehydrogenase-like predicted oxidoreductase
MQQNVLGKTGLEVSPIGFGTAPVGLLAVDQAHTATLLNALLDDGVNVIDTAAAYAGAEQAIGAAVAGRRDQFVLITKCGSPGSPADDVSWTEDDLLASVDRSLIKLRTDHVDVMLLHSCTLATLERGEALSALSRARDAGKIRHIGYSGDNQEAVYACRLPEIAVVEISINICDQANIDLVLPVTAQNEIGVIAKRPLANAAWKELHQQPGFYQQYAGTYTQRFAAMQVFLRETGLNLDRLHWPEVAARFPLTLPRVHSAVVGSTNLAHVRSNLAAAEKGPLPDAVYEHLRQAFRLGEERSGAVWSGQT